MEKNKKKLKRRFHFLKYFFRIMEVRTYHVIIPIILSFIQVGFGGISIGLLIPLAKGIVDGNYEFIKTVPVLSKIIGILPLQGLWGLSYDKTVFLFIAILIFIITCLKHLISYFTNLLNTYWNGLFDRRIKTYFFNRIISFGKFYFDTTSQGYIRQIIGYSNRLLSVLKLFQSTIKSIFDVLVRFAIMLIISWKLTLFTLFLFPILHFSLKNIIKIISVFSEKRTRVGISLSKKVFNILSCIPLIKAYSKEREVQKVYRDYVEQVRKISFSSTKFSSLTGPINDILITSALILMVGFVTFLISRDSSANLGVFMVFFYVARTALPSFTIFNTIRTKIAQLKPPLKELAYILEEGQDKGLIQSGDLKFQGLKKEIKINQLTFSYYKKAKVLKEISFTIKKGEMTAIVGPTGAGKTTIINLLMRLYELPEKSIFFDGIDIRRFKLKSLKSQMSIVTQIPFLFNETIRQNLLFGALKIPDEQDINRALKKAMLYDFVQKLPQGLDTLVGDRGIRLSGGEQQRLSIARAFLRNTEILILDEATSSLDTKTEQLIQKAINSVVSGRTTIVIAHRLSTIKNADNIVVIERGKTIEEGPIEELLEKKGKFYQYWNLQSFL